MRPSFARFCPPCAAATLPISTLGLLNWTMTSFSAGLFGYFLTCFSRSGDMFALRGAAHAGLLEKAIAAATRAQLHVFIAIDEACLGVCCFAISLTSSERPRTRTELCGAFPRLLRQHSIGAAPLAASVAFLR